MKVRHRMISMPFPEWVIFEREKFDESLPRIFPTKKRPIPPMKNCQELRVKASSFSVNFFIKAEENAEAMADKSKSPSPKGEISSPAVPFRFIMITLKNPIAQPAHFRRDIFS